MEDRKLLPLPGRYDQESYKISKVPCGFLAVELALVASGARARLGNKKLAGLSNILGVMLPKHIVWSLRRMGLRSKCYTDTDDLDRVKMTIDAGKPAILLFWCGVGHWVTVWGYDDHNFYLFDNRARLQRDENGLVTMSHEEVLRLWGEIPPHLKVIQWLLRPLEHVKPFTMITFS